MLTINKTIENGKAILTPAGRLDTVTAPEMEGVIKGLLQTVNDLILDFAQLDYISSAGLRVLLSTQKAIAEKGKMKITNVNDTIMEIFDVTGFSDILTIE